MKRPKEAIINDLKLLVREYEPEILTHDGELTKTQVDRRLLNLNRVTRNIKKYSSLVT